MLQVAHEYGVAILFTVCMQEIHSPSKIEATTALRCGRELTSLPV
jgi:hypothetical protein